MSHIRHEARAPTHTLRQGGGATIDRHRHDEHQLIYVSAGVIAIHTEHGAWVAANDRALWIPAGTWHEHRFYGSTEFHTVGFGTGRAPLAPNAPTVIAVDPLLRELLIALTADAVPEIEARRIRAVVRDRLRVAVQAPFVLPRPTDPRLTDACAAVEVDLSQPRSLRWLADHAKVGERTLSRLFRDEFGMTYPQWRTRARLFAAMIMLAEGGSVTETARATGWATTSAFVDAFGRAMNVTPGAHRRPPPIR